MLPISRKLGARSAAWMRRSLGLSTSARALTAVLAGGLAFALAVPGIASAVPRQSAQAGPTAAYVTTQSPSVLLLGRSGPVPAGRIAVGAAQRDVALSHDGQRLYAVTDAGIAVIDTARRRVVTTITSPSFFGIRGIAYLPRAHKLYVANRWSEVVSVVDARTNRVVANVPTPTHAIDVAAAPSWQVVYAGSYGYLQTIDARTDRVFRTIRTGILAGAVAADVPARRVFVADQESPALGVVDLRTGRVRTLARETTDVAVDDRAHRAYLSGPSGVDVVDSRSLRRLGRLALTGAGRLALSSDGRRGYVLAGDSLIVFRPHTMRTISRTRLPAPPVALVAR